MLRKDWALRMLAGVVVSLFIHAVVLAVAGSGSAQETANIATAVPSSCDCDLEVQAAPEPTMVLLSMRTLRNQ